MPSVTGHAYTPPRVCLYPQFRTPYARISDVVTALDATDASDRLRQSGEVGDDSYASSKLLYASVCLLCFIFNAWFEHIEGLG